MKSKFKLRFGLTLTLLITLSVFASPIFSRSVNAACDNARITNFTAAPWVLVTKRPYSFFEVKLSTYCSPSDQKFKIYFESTERPGVKLYETEFGAKTFSDSGNNYVGTVEVKTTPFESQDSEAKILSYTPIIESNGKVLARGTESQQQQVINASIEDNTTLPDKSVNSPDPNQQPGNSPKASEPLPEIKNKVGVDNAMELISKVIRILLLLIAAGAVLMLIVSGLRMISSSGNPANLQSAKRGAIWAVLGLVIAMLSFTIVSVIQRLI